MPRFVRPAWLTAYATDRQTTVGLGPRSAIGYVGGKITLRTPSGSVSDPIRFDAGGPTHRLTFEVPAGMLVSLNGEEARTYPETFWLAVQPGDAS